MTSHSSNEKISHSHGDLESGALDGGASLGRQISVQLTPEQFERLYLQPGGTQARGDLSKRFANPTPLGVASFLLTLTPVSCYLMGWGSTSLAAATSIVGAMFLVGGLGCVLAGMLEFILGNTFTFVAFITLGCLWFSLGFLLQPTQGIAAALGGLASPEYNAGIALYLYWWAAMVFIYWIATLRTNVVFSALFASLDIFIWLFATTFLRLSYGHDVATLFKATGAFGFITCAMGWWLQVALIFDSVGIPVKLPVGDLSGFLAGPVKRNVD
ncbi:hypothetical protein JCM1840_000443 [Sporobolomyces johnsonii]